MKNIILVFLVVQIILSCTNSKNLSKVSSKTSLNTSQPDTLAFEMTDANNIVFKTVINETDTLDLYWDTGGTALVLKHSTIREKTTLLDGKNENYNGENYIPLEGVYPMSLGNLNWDSLTIYPTSLLPKEADGHFGWNLFKENIVELDYERNLMIVHTSFSRDLDKYAKLEMEYINTLFCINGTIQIGEQSYSNRYLFDSGFQRAIVLDKDLRAESQFPTDLKVIKESKLRNSEGTEFINSVVEVEKICFDDVCAEQVPVQLFSTPNPAQFETHILGNEFLKRFNTVLDFQNGFVYMKPNALIDLPYMDAS